jgi:hypothetical protein
MSPEMTYNGYDFYAYQPSQGTGYDCEVFSEPRTFEVRSQCVPIFF